MGWKRSEVDVRGEMDTLMRMMGWEWLNSVGLLWLTVPRRGEVRFLVGVVHVC